MRGIVWGLIFSFFLYVTAFAIFYAVRGLT